MSNGTHPYAKSAVNLTPGREVSFSEASAGIAVVYYVKRHRLIKIGTTTNLADRLRHLGCKPSDVLAVEFGGHDLERLRHQQFAHLLHAEHEGREHFRLGPSLKQHILSLRAQALGKTA